MWEQSQLIPDGSLSFLFQLHDHPLGLCTYERRDLCFLCPHTVKWLPYLGFHLSTLILSSFTPWGHFPFTVLQITR